MLERNESSVAVSLKELLRLEEQRVEEETRTRRVQEAAERHAAAEWEARARAEEEARQQAVASRAHAEAVADREREARLAAMKEADIVRARQETEVAARMEELHATQEHERELAALRAATRQKGLARAAYGAFALLALTWALGGWHLLRTARQSSEERASYREASAEQRNAYERLQGAYKEQSDAVATLQNRIADLSRDDAASMAPYSRVTSNPRHLSPSRPSVTAAARGTTTAPHPPCKPGDPLCSDIP